ncbi:hypothetical protein Sjap_003074 [Stephania japonica]|uniref:Uncharacterized protein n=1 Tax=Stephania japonica TaxID=461633 RepID=A0AAP0KQG2_9MAGN
MRLKESEMERKSSIDATNHEIIATYKAKMTTFKTRFFTLDNNAKRLFKANSEDENYFKTGFFTLDNNAKRLFRLIRKTKIISRWTRFFTLDNNAKRLFRLIRRTKIISSFNPSRKFIRDATLARFTKTSKCHYTMFNKRRNREMERKSSIGATNHEIIATYKASTTTFKARKTRLANSADNKYFKVGINKFKSSAFTVFISFDPCRKVHKGCYFSEVHKTSKCRYTMFNKLSCGCGKCKERLMLIGFDFKGFCLVFIYIVVETEQSISFHNEVTMRSCPDHEELVDHATKGRYMQNAAHIRTRSRFNGISWSSIFHKTIINSSSPRLAMENRHPPEIPNSPNLDS